MATGIPPISTVSRFIPFAGLFVAGFILGGGSVWLWFSGPHTEPAQPLIVEEQQDEVAEKGVYHSTVSVENQPAGLTARISSVSLDEAGWIAILEDREGEPANILGARRFDAGIYHDVSIELLRGTVPGGLYYAMVRVDNGDSAFYPAQDIPVTDSEGLPIMSSFAALGL